MQYVIKKALDSACEDQWWDGAMFTPDEQKAEHYDWTTLPRMIPVFDDDDTSAERAIPAHLALFDRLSFSEIRGIYYCESWQTVAATVWQVQ